MDPGDEKSHMKLVTELTNGFGAMLEQVQELARRNTDLQQRLATVLEAVSSFLVIGRRRKLAVMKQYSSRPRTTYVVVIDTLHIG